MEKVRVNREVCIGCGACQGIASNIFEIDEEGLATVIEGSDIKESEEAIQDAADMCPTSAIVIDE